MANAEFRSFLGAEVGPRWICRRTIVWAQSLVEVKTPRARFKAANERRRQNALLFDLPSQKPIDVYDHLPSQFHSVPRFPRGRFTHATRVAEDRSVGRQRCRCLGKEIERGFDR